VSDTSALGGFLKAVRDKRVEAGTTLIVETFDRLSRQAVTTALKQFLELLEAGVIVVTLIDGQRYDLASVNDNPMSLQYSIMLMATANVESRNKADRLGQTWIRKRELAEQNQKRLTGMCPGWLKPQGDGFSIIEERAEIVRRVYLLVAGGRGAMLVARVLNDEKVPLIGSGQRTLRAGTWSQSTIKYIINNRAAEGFYQPHTGRGSARKPVGEPILNYFPRIVAADLAQQARDGMALRRNDGAGRRGEAANLLSGIAVCAECMGSMGFIRGGKRSRPDYLRCTSFVRHAGCDNGTRYLYRKIENALLAQVTVLAVDPPASDHDPAQDLVGRLAEVTQQAKAARQEADRLTNRLASEDDAPEAILNAIRAREANAKRLDADAAFLRREIESVRAQLPTRDSYAEVERLVMELQDEACPPDQRLSRRLAMRQSLKQICDMIMFYVDRTALVCVGGFTITFQIDSGTGAVSGIGYHVGGETRFKCEDGTLSLPTPSPEFVAALQRRIPGRVMDGVRRLLRAAK
jgi:DNA invertase Pin-like site-specific DNA recombinase